MYRFMLVVVVSSFLGFFAGCKEEVAVKPEPKVSLDESGAAGDEVKLLAHHIKYAHGTLAEAKSKELDTYDLEDAIERAEAVLPELKKRLEEAIKEDNVNAVQAVATQGYDESFALVTSANAVNKKLGRGITVIEPKH